MLPGDVQDTAVSPEPTGQASPDPVEQPQPVYVSRDDFDRLAAHLTTTLRQMHEREKQSLRDTTARNFGRISPRLQEYDRVVEFLKPWLAEGADPAAMKQQLGLNALLEEFGQPLSSTATAQNANNGAEPPGQASPQGPPDWLIAEAESILTANGLTGGEPEIGRLHAEGNWGADAQGYLRYIRDLEAVARRLKAGRAAQPAPPAPPAPRPAGPAAAVDIGSGQGVASRSLETVGAELEAVMRTEPRNIEKIRTLRAEHADLLTRAGMVRP